MQHKFNINIGIRCQMEWIEMPENGGTLWLSKPIICEPGVYTVTVDQDPETGRNDVQVQMVMQ